MDDGHFNGEELEGLLLVRAFLRIRDPDRRALVIDLAERLTDEAASAGGILGLLHGQAPEDSPV